MDNHYRISNKYLIQSPVSISFRYETIDINDTVDDDGVTKCRVRWAPIQFTSRQLKYFEKEIKCLLEWYENDISHRCYTSHGLIVHWYSTYEPAHQFLAS